MKPLELRGSWLCGLVREWVMKERLLMKQGRSWKGVLLFSRYGEEEREGARVYWALSG